MVVDDLPVVNSPNVPSEIFRLNVPAISVSAIRLMVWIVKLSASVPVSFAATFKVSMMTVEIGS